MQIFGNKYLRELVKKDQEKIDIKFDVSLVDTTFLDYHENDQFIYFWDMPQSVFPLVIPLIRYPASCYFILRGLCLSLGGITASTSDSCVKAVDEYINTYDQDKNELAHRILDTFFTILDRYKKIERFITPIFNTLSFFYKMNDFFAGEGFEEKHLRVINIMHDELISTKFSSKLVAGAELLCGTISAILGQSKRSQEDNLQLLKEKKILELMSHLLNHEYAFSY